MCEGSPAFGFCILFVLDDSMTDSRGPTVLSCMTSAKAGRSHREITSFFRFDTDEAKRLGSDRLSKARKSRTTLRGPMARYRAGGPMRLSIDEAVAEGGEEVVSGDEDTNVEADG